MAGGGDGKRNGGSAQCHRGRRPIYQCLCAGGGKGAGTPGRSFEGDFRTYSLGEWRGGKNLKHKREGEDEPENAPLPKEGLLFPKSRRELLEVTHVHTFSMPLIFFVLSRILSMTATREGLKLATYVASFVGIVCNLIGPWLVRYVSPGFSLLLLSSYIVLAGVMIVYIVCPMYEMWGTKEEEGKGMLVEE